MPINLGRINYSTSRQWNGCFFFSTARKKEANAFYRYRKTSQIILLSENSKVWDSVTHTLMYDICLKKLKMSKKRIVVRVVLATTWEWYTGLVEARLCVCLLILEI